MSKLSTWFGLRFSMMALPMLLFLVFTGSTSHAQCSAIDGATGIELSGDQPWTGSLGMRFTVNSPIEVTRLGAYDSDQNGFSGTITVGIVNAAGTVVVPAITMTGNSDPLVTSFRMRNISPVTLGAGTYTVVAFGFSVSDPNGNTNAPFSSFAATTNSGGGLITHVDSPWDNNPVMAVPASGVHSVGGFHAGNFTFRSVLPVLSATINGVNITTNNDGVADNGTFAICSGPPSPNVTMGAFSVSGPSGAQVKVYQEIVLTNATQSGAWCNGISGAGCSAAPGLFAGSTNTFTKTVVTSPGSVLLRFRAYYDANNNNNLDAGDCAGDWAQFTVNFESQAPVITCPSNITVNADALECAVPVTYSLPTTSDLPCTGTVTLTHVSGPASGADFPVGINTVTYMATDAAGNTNTCSFTVTVNDYPAPPLGCKNVQVSLDADCEAVITPTIVLTGWEGPGGTVLLGCEDLFEINITTHTGQNVGNVINATHVGKTLSYTITHPTIPTCGGEIYVEDKIAPTITCRDITVNCLADLSKVVVAFPDDNCHATLKLVDETHAALECDDEFIGKVTRTYVAVDGAGNESAPCTATIWLARSNTDDVTPPPSEVKLRCSDNYKKDNRGFGYPAPSETGVPVYDDGDIKFPLYPLSQLNMVYCNSTIDYRDQLILTTDCKTRIMRTWMITEWWCSQSVQKFVAVQVIDIVDDLAPVIPQLDDITVTTQTRSCTGLVTLPKLTITDNCNKIYHVYANATQEGQPTGYIDGNGGTMYLGVGEHIVTYSALDNCSNQSQMSFVVTVRDDTDPVAICDQYATVSIKTNGYTEITASAVDDGSFDECGPVTLKLRRMEDPCDFGHDDDWFDKVGFCCLDANTSRMVQLLVTDKGGNTNICMVNVEVQDKVTPSITCPGDLTISDCNFTFDPNNPAAYFGAVTVSDNCPANNIIRDVVDDQRTQCGTGDVIRTVTVGQGRTIFGTCTQTITFENNYPFYINDLNHNDPGDDITWPKDYLALGQCTFAGLLPETLPDSSRMPVFTEDACDLVGMRYEDQVFPFTTNGACYKIIRRWFVIDWCQTDDNNEPKTWIHEQEIKVVDNNRPTLILPVTKVVFETLNCSSEEVTLSATAIDCTPSAELKWYYEIFEGTTKIASGNTRLVRDEFELGDYRIYYRVEDRCGNVSDGSYEFSVESVKAPTAICKQGLAAPLVLMDTDGNGSGDTPLLMLAPEYFDNKSSHSCPGVSVDLSFSADVDDDLVTFGCEDVGKQPIELWVTDQYGNTSYCSTFIDVQRHTACPNNLAANIYGRTLMENEDMIQNVSVRLLGSEAVSVTNNLGSYAFQPMPLGNIYTVEPAKDGDDMNGVSTLDIVMIQRHILGMEKLKSPYRMIAADANGNGTITASDLTDLRKLVLGLTQDLPNNRSWRFVDAGYQFPDPNDPWLEPFAETYHINGLTNDMEANFIGIKIGDVNGNAKGSAADTDEAESRSASLGIEMDDVYVNAGQTLEIPVRIATGSTLYGMQGSFVFDGIHAEDMVSGKLNTGSGQFAGSDTGVAFSIAEGEGVSLKEGEILFTMVAKAERSGRLSDMVRLGTMVRPEVYTDQMNTKPLSVKWGGRTQTTDLEVRVHPNPWTEQTVLNVTSDQDSRAVLTLRDVTGRTVHTRVESLKAGENIVTLQRSDAGMSGVYFFEIRTNSKTATGKIILID